MFKCFQCTCDTMCPSKANVWQKLHLLHSPSPPWWDQQYIFVMPLYNRYKTLWWLMRKYILCCACWSNPTSPPSTDTKDWNSGGTALVKTCLAKLLRWSWWRWWWWWWWQWNAGMVTESMFWNVKVNFFSFIELQMSISLAFHHLCVCNRPLSQGLIFTARFFWFSILNNMS